MRTFVIVCLLGLSTSAIAQEAAKPVGYKKSIGRIQQAMQIKQCLRNPDTKACLTGEDLSMMQRVLSLYVVAESNRVARQMTR